MPYQVSTWTRVRTVAHNLLALSTAAPRGRKHRDLATFPWLHGACPSSPRPTVYYIQRPVPCSATTRHPAASEDFPWRRHHSFIYTLAPTIFRCLFCRGHTSPHTVSGACPTQPWPKSSKEQRSCSSPAAFSACWSWRRSTRCVYPFGLTACLLPGPPLDCHMFSTRVCLTLRLHSNRWSDGELLNLSPHRLIPRANPDAMQPLSLSVQTLCFCKWNPRW